MCVVLISVSLALQFSEDELVADAFANLRDEVTVQTKTSAPRKGKGKGARGRRSGEDDKEDVVPVLTIRDRFGSKEDDEEDGKMKKSKRMMTLMLD